MLDPMLEEYPYAGPANAGNMGPVCENFRETIRPVAERLTEEADIQEGVRQQFCTELVVSYSAWFDHVLGQVTVAIDEAIQSVRPSAISLHQELTRFDSLLRSYQADPSLIDPRDPQFCAAAFLNNEILRATVPPLNIGGVLAALSAIIKTAKLTDNDECHQGTPIGIRRFPALDGLVFMLELAALAAGTSFTVFINQNGQVAVAAGTLIKSLDMLRTHLAARGPDVRWLIRSLPTSDQHQACVPSYQRILREARKCHSDPRPLADLPFALRRLKIRIKNPTLL
jgi:hypothetical protein